MDAVDPARPVFIVAQGLLMYLEPDLVRQLLQDLAAGFPAAEMVFDVVPRWYSRLTLFGLQQTRHYRLPRMPWGIDRDQLEPTLRGWLPGLARVALLHYRMPRGVPLLLASMAHFVPVVRHQSPSLVQIVLPEKLYLRAMVSDIMAVEWDA
jgi:hypothetical protein